LVCVVCILHFFFRIFWECILEFILFDFYLGLNVDIDIRKSFSVLIHR
jgi:hypothetical protein